MRKVSVAVLVAAAAAGPVGALQTEEPAKPRKERLVCREQPNLGTRLNARRICLTAAEWGRVARASRDEVDRFVARPTATKAGPDEASPR